MQLATNKLRRCKGCCWKFQFLCDSLICFDRDGFDMPGILGGSLREMQLLQSVVSVGKSANTWMADEGGRC